MLTPEKVKNVSFQTTGRGSYRSDEVDEYVREVSASYEKVFKENGELIRKISILANKVEEYRKDEDSLRQALFTAQKVADQIVAEAKAGVDGKLEEAETQASKIICEANEKAEQLVTAAQQRSAELVRSTETETAALLKNAAETAQDTISKAETEAKEMLGKVNRQVTHESLVFEMLQKEASAFRSKLLGLYKEHLNLINELPEIASAQMEEAEVSAKEAVESGAPQATEETAATAEAVAEPIEETEPVELEVEIEVELAPEASAEQMTLEEAEASAEEAPAPREESEEAMIFEDISSGRQDDDDDAEEIPEQDDGFVLNVSAMDLSEEEPESDFSDFRIDQVRHFSGTEAAGEKAAERPSSFKSFFKKK